MISRLSTSFLIISILLISVGTAIGAGETSFSSRSITFPTDPFSFQAGSGQNVANTYCIICHSADYIYMQPPHSQEKWNSIITKMKNIFGCPIPDDQISVLASYLFEQNSVVPKFSQYP